VNNKILPFLTPTLEAKLYLMLKEQRKSLSIARLKFVTSVKTELK